MARSFVLYSAILIDELLIGTARLVHSPRINRGGRYGRRSQALIIAPPGGGNIGDQALVDSCVGNLTGPILVIANKPSSFDSSTWSQGSVQQEFLPGLLYGYGVEHARDLFRFATLWRQSSQVLVIGADIMDGGYNPLASYRRARFSALFSNDDVASRVVGFSWNGRAHAVCKWGLRRAARRGVALFIRDPASLRRAADDGVVAIPTADAVFATPSLRGPSENVSRIMQLIGRRPYALVNASGFVGRSYDQVEDYLLVIEHLDKSGLTPVLVPHVIRGSGDDLKQLAQIHTSARPGSTILVDELLTPSDIRHLCGSASAVVAGRMHLAVLALKQGVAPVVVSTQGKVSGLLELFNLGECLVEPGVGMGDRLVSALDGVAARTGRSSVRPDDIARATSLASKNFAAVALESAAPAGDRLWQRSPRV